MPRPRRAAGARPAPGRGAAGLRGGAGLPADVGGGAAAAGVVAVCSGLLVLRPCTRCARRRFTLDVADGAAESDALALSLFLERPSATTRVSREATSASSGATPTPSRLPPPP